VHLRSALVVGGLLLLGGNGLLSIGERHLASGLAALIVATVPVWMIAINAAATRTGVTPATVLALGLGTAGVAVLIGGIGGTGTVGAAVVVLVASALWAAGSVYARTAPLPRHPLVVTSLEMIVGGVLLLAAGAATGELRGFDIGAVSAGSLFGRYCGLSGVVSVAAMFLPAGVQTADELTNASICQRPAQAVLPNQILNLQAERLVVGEDPAGPRADVPAAGLVDVVGLFPPLGPGILPADGDPAVLAVGAGEGAGVEHPDVPVGYDDVLRCLPGVDRELQRPAVLPHRLGQARHPGGHLADRRPGLSGCVRKFVGGGFMRPRGRQDGE
jgi:hypothetical protein